MDKTLLKRLIILALFLVVLFGGVFGWHAFVRKKIKQKAAAMAHQKVTVSVATATQTKWPSRIQATASLAAIQGVMLSPQLAGMVVGIHFHSGQQVKEGQLLVQLNDANQRAQLATDQAGLALAKANLARQKALYHEHNTSQLNYQQAQTTYEKEAAAVKSDKATIAKLQVRAPFAGHLGIRKISLGQYLSPSSQVVNLQQWSPIYANFQLPQTYVHRLKLGQPASLTVKGEAGHTHRGKVTAIGSQVNAQTRNVEVQATFPNEQNALRPGMYGMVSVTLGNERKELSVPETAVAYNTYGTYVYVIHKGKNGLVAKERLVKVGESRKGRTAILKGISAGATVVTTGQVKLYPGALVKISKSSNSDTALHSSGTNGGQG